MEAADAGGGLDVAHRDEGGGTGTSGQEPALQIAGRCVHLGAALLWVHAPQDGARLPTPRGVARTHRHIEQEMQGPQSRTAGEKLRLILMFND